MNKDMKTIPLFKDKYAFLSNFFSSPFDWNGKYWPTVEHAYQASKAKHPQDQYRIQSAISPAVASKMGREVVIQEDWEKVKVPIMTELVWAKFDQNSELMNKLMDTGSAELIEGNYWHDNFWGDCYCKNCIGQKGKNMLGFILMMIRRDMLAALRPSPLNKEQKLREAVFFYIEAKKA